MNSYTVKYFSKVDPSKTFIMRFWAKNAEEARKEANNFMLIDQWTVVLEENGKSGKAA